MRLAISLGSFADRIDGQYTSSIESMRRCKAAGFCVLDARFFPSLHGKTELVKDNWQELIYELRDEAEKLGVEFSQSHPVFVPGADIKQHPAEMQELFDEMMRRSIIASSILGVKWAVLHPVTDKSIEFSLETIIQRNLEFYEPVTELAAKYNVGLAFENLPEKPGDSKRKYISRADELAELVDMYHAPQIGVCWDFGHANLIYRDQATALRTLGKRLKATHVADNSGVSDDHLFPFHGSINWHSIMPVLTDIGYDGDFTYEATREFSKLPDNLKDGIAKIGYEIGMYCLSLC